jgi:hypothetical protein
MLLFASLVVAASPPLFTDAAPSLPFANVNGARLCMADLNGDGEPDVVIRERGADGKPDHYRVFLNTSGDRGVLSFAEVGAPNLPTPRDGDMLVFADFDNDGKADGLFTRYLDVNNPKFTEPESEPKRTAILPGRGDGTFGPPDVLEPAPRGTAAAVAVADVDGDGLLDVFLANWYWNYGDDLRAFPSVLLERRRNAAGALAWYGSVPPGVDGDSDHAAFDAEPKYDPEQQDTHRPLYGAMIVELGDFSRAPGGTEGAWGTRGILGLAYGRRANVLWVPYRDRHEPARLRWMDLAPLVGLDADADRSGEYPEWLKERAKTDKRFDRQTEKPFRTGGNNFDGAVGDIDNDGDWDLFIADITHAWAGPSADRSRFLVNRLVETGELKFEYDPRLCVDRIPGPDAGDEALHKWNQGDMFCELADLDNDGRLDLVLSSGDYPDPPPFDERLRVFHQEADGTFKDVTAEWGIDNPGSAQISLADVDLDGDVDILVGQSFNRFPAEMVEGITKKQNSTGPTAKLYLNQTSERRKEAGLPANGYTFIVTGNPAKGVNSDAIGTVIRMTCSVGGKTVTQMRQLVGIGGCNGKQNAFQLHMALPEGASKADAVDIVYRNGDVVTLRDVPPGVVRPGR